MEYPRLVFISPGSQKCGGGTYDHELVKDEKEHKAAIEAGFSDSVPDALESAKLVKAEMSEDKPKRGRKPKEQNDVQG
jgi:hypothetical protein